METRFFIFLFTMISVWVNAQVENNSSIRIDRQPDPDTSKYSLSSELSKPELNSDFTLYKVPEHLEDYARNKKSFSMIDDNGLLKPTADEVPKWFKAGDKPEKDFKSEYYVDQYLGTFKSGGNFVMLLYRDHGSVDGDLVRIFLDNNIIRGQEYLLGSFKTIKIDLVEGANKIDVLALNEGEASPNTAEFQLYDDKGNLITSNEWNLATGVRASFTVFK